MHCKYRSRGWGRCGGFWAFLGEVLAKKGRHVFLFIIVQTCFHGTCEQAGIWGYPEQRDISTQNGMLMTCYCRCSACSRSSCHPLLPRDHINPSGYESEEPFSKKDGGIKSVCKQKVPGSRRAPKFIKFTADSVLVLKLRAT